MKIFKQVVAAKKQMKGVVSPTPLIQSLNLSEEFSSTVLLKREDLQIVRSYKIRGAYNKMSTLTEEEKKQGVVCASAGNHAQGVAYSCNLLKIKGKIYMPKTTPKQKIKQVQLFGKSFVEIVLIGDTFDDAILLLDEAQNCEMTDLMLWITRMGKTSKAVMMGDVSQYDINKKDAKFLTFIDILKDLSEVAHFAFTQDDIMRHELLKKIVERYEKWKYKIDGITNTANTTEIDNKIIKS